MVNAQLRAVLSWALGEPRAIRSDVAPPPSWGSGSMTEISHSGGSVLARLYRKDAAAGLSSGRGGPRDAMGQVVEKVKVRNFGDVFNAAQGSLDEKEIRTTEVDAIVDSGSSLLCLPPPVIEELGLLHTHSQAVQTANGAVERRIFGGAEITIKERYVEMEVMENDSTTPPLVGFLVLGALDFVIDPKAGELVGNPRHDGKWVMDLF